MGSPSLGPPVWMNFGIGASVRHYATRLFLWSCATCWLGSLYIMRKCTECVIYSSWRFDQTSAYYRPVWPRLPWGLAWASHKLNPALRLPVITCHHERCEILRSACLYVCLSARISQKRMPIVREIFCACAWLGHFLAVVQYVMYFRFREWRHVFILVVAHIRSFDANKACIQQSSSSCRFYSYLHFSNEYTNVLQQHCTMIQNCFYCVTRKTT